ncbi:MAG: PepSY domain-containing protein [Porticoccaceae bacterium]|nr:PepSY domain-containing protein [Porticoccaceae bacterium]
MNRLLRQAHKYLSLAISIQLLLWTVSGIYFAFNDIGDIRGSQYLLDQPAREFVISGRTDMPKAQGISYFYRLDQLLIEAKTEEGVKFFQSDGSPVEILSEDQVKVVVEQNTTLIAGSVSQITKAQGEAEAGSEYRGRALPLYRVEASAGEKLVNVYVNPYSGKIVALRSDAWRTWDFLWGLHIMDWDERDDFGNLFMRFFSILALISALSGILLYFKIRQR